MRENVFKKGDLIKAGNNYWVKMVILNELKDNYFEVFVVSSNLLSCGFREWYEKSCKV